MKIAIGSDHAGYRLKDQIVNHLKNYDYSIQDFGVFSEESVDYPDIASIVAGFVQMNKLSCGILICGTGIGMSIAANKYRGIRAALCSETYSACCSRQHNDANILAIGSRVIGTGLAIDIVETFTKTEFEGGRHSRRIEKINQAEQPD